MKFSTLKQEIVKYITKKHKHSSWNLKFLHTTVSTKNGLKHYVIYYNAPKCKFSIHVCKNNIKFNKIQNIPGSVSSLHSRILGPCVRFARNHDKYNGMSEKKWHALQEANKWEQYDIRQFDRTYFDHDLQSDNVSVQTAVWNMLTSPKHYLGRNFKCYAQVIIHSDYKEYEDINEYTIMQDFYKGNQLSYQNHQIVKHLLHLYRVHNSVDLREENHNE